MPIYTVYAKIVKKGKRRGHKVRNAPVHSIFEEIVDWADLKSVLLDAARAIHWEFEQTVTEITLEKHLGGRYITKTTSYRQTKVHYRRQFDFKARLTYSKSQDSVKIESPVFGSPEFYQFKPDYEAETGKKWKIPKVVPSSFEALLHSDNPDALFVDMLTLKTVSYQAQPRNLYASTQEKQHTQGMYAGTPKGIYAGKEHGLAEQDRIQRQNKH
jgi:hypothetical protein